MARGRKIGVYETVEIFNSIKELAEELGCSSPNIIYHINKSPLYGLHFYYMPCGIPKCIHCSVFLTNENWYESNQKARNRICKNCCLELAKKREVKQRKEDWVGYKCSLINRRYRVKIDKQDLKDLFENQKGKCNLCGSELDYSCHIDHIIPLSKKGKTEIENLQFLCEKCNRGKYSWTQGDYIEHCIKVAKYNIKRG